MVFKSLNDLAPEYLSSKFINRSDTSQCTHRDSVNKLAIPFGHELIIFVIVFAIAVLFSGIASFKM